MTASISLSNPLLCFCFWLGSDDDDDDRFDLDDFEDDFDDDELSDAATEPKEGSPPREALLDLDPETSEDDDDSDLDSDSDFLLFTSSRRPVFSFFPFCCFFLDCADGSDPEEDDNISSKRA